MLLYDLIRVEVPMGRVRDRILGPERNGWTTLVERAAMDGEGTGRIRVGLGGHRSPFVTTFRVELSLPMVRASDIVVGFKASPIGLRALFPSVSGEIEINPAGAGGTLLTVHGRYRPPLGALGRVIDRSQARRLAQAVLHSLVREVADHLSSGSRLGKPSSIAA